MDCNKEKVTPEEFENHCRTCQNSDRCRGRRARQVYTAEKKGVSEINLFEVPHA